MYKLLNKLFRWEYVLVQYGFKHYCHRVYFDAYGEAFVKMHGTCQYLKHSRVIYLTFKAEKYKIEKKQND